MIRRALSAHTSHPNSKETDLLPYVEHDVTVCLDKGQKEVVRLMASDPLTAIELVNDMGDSRYASLPRVKGD